MNEAKRTVLSFEEILERETRILMDTSIEPVEGDEWYWEGVYPAKKFSGLDMGTLKLEIASLEFALSFITNPNVYTTQGVLLELKRMNDLVIDKFKFLSNPLRSSKKLKRRRFQREEEFSGETERNLLKEIQCLFYKFHKEAKRSIFSPRNKQEYQTLERIVKSVTAHTGAKVDFDFYYRVGFHKMGLKDFHANEELVSTSLYLAFFEGLGSCIVTRRDSGIKGILANTLRYLAQSTTTNYDISFLGDECPVRVYNSTERERITIDFDSYRFNPTFYDGHFDPGVIELIDRTKTKRN